jgi:putative aldouronate transport system permease protein
MFGIIIAFQDYVGAEGVLGSEFVGFKNFYDILFNPMTVSYREIRNTVYISIIRIVTNFPIILIFTLVVNEIKSKQAKGLVQAISYIPYYISWISVGGMAYNLFKLDGGIFNQLIVHFGGTPFDWYTKVDYWWWILAASSLWKGMGWSTLIYLSALSAIDLELYEACEIDGGGRFRKMISVTIPGIMNVIMIQLILDIASVLSDNYDQIMAMINKADALSETTKVIGAIEFNAVSGSSGQSRATAYGLLRGVIGLILVFATNKIAKGSGNEGIM